MRNVMRKCISKLRFVRGRAPAYATGCIFLFPPAAIAAGSSLPEFSELDRNRNGRIEMKEAKAFFDERAWRADFNRNGKLDATEISDAVDEMNERQAANYIDLMDRDRDDELSYDELSQDLPMIFRLIDADRDGTVSREEYGRAAARLGN